MIIASRIDGRLIHGQVANLWTPSLKVDRIIVVDDKVAESSVEKSGLRLAAPAGVRLSVLPMERAARQITEGRYGDQRLLIVAKRPKPFLDLVERGVKIETLNVGNMSQSNETTSVTRSVNVLDDEVQIFEDLSAKGVKLVNQMVPQDPEKDFMPLLHEAFNKG